jgi:hypothetical protein
VNKSEKYRAEMSRLLDKIRSQSVATGGDKITMDEINAEIAAYRRGE